VSLPENRAIRDAGRLYVLLVVMLGALLVLGGKLWRVQVMQTELFADSLKGQSVRRVRLPAPRGLIYDRNGVCLADNRPSYCVAIYVEEVRRRGAWSNTVNKVEEIVEDLSRILGVEPQVDRDDIERHILRRRLLPFLAWHDIDQTNTLARLWEYNQPLPGVGIYVEPRRVYPKGSTMAHVLGYVGRADMEPSEEFHFYLPEFEGKKGIEAQSNERLAGQAGGRLIQVNAAMLKHKVIEEKPPIPGEDIRLTIDVRIQELAEAALAGERGACVIVDPRDGDILAMASAPAFDPNLFVPSISVSDWNRLNDDQAKPFLNRATREHYPPGSIFKPVVALAALENDKATEGTTFSCPGYYTVGKSRFRCWQRHGHGTLNLRQAIEQSCNPYFCQLGLKTGYERIRHMASAVGLGDRTGIEIGEVRGLLPKKAWKGDTCNLSIGQGALTATPLQMAVVAATIANRGHLYRARLIRRRREGEELMRMQWSRRTLDTVRGGMYDVIQDDTGTGDRARVDGVAMGGKTGTAEYGPRGKRKLHTWMMAFAPFERPRYALAMIIQDGISGGKTVAPRVRVLMEGVFRLDGTLPAERVGKRAGERVRAELLSRAVPEKKRAGGGGSREFHPPPNCPGPRRLGAGLTANFNSPIPPSIVLLVAGSREQGPAVGQ